MSFQDLKRIFIMKTINYPLPEQIGNPELLVGREKEFAKFEKWIKRIPKRLSKSRAVLARKKSGKTAFIQRIFNKLWYENSDVIPFYIDIAEKKIWYPDFAIEYYRKFASQYISFLERDKKLITLPLSLEKINEYGKKKSIEPFVEDAGFLLQNKKSDGSHDLMWEIAYTAPHRFANLFNQSILVMIDEFQNLSQYIYLDKNHQILEETIPGSYHYYSESKAAPMLVTGSYIGWMISIISKYLEAGRLHVWNLAPYLSKEDGLQAVYKYAEAYEEPVTNESAALINHLCQSDPFFISCVIQSDYEDKDLLTTQGIIDTVYYEISDRDAMMSKTWTEYIELALDKINDLNAKNILLHLNKHSDRYWTPKELKQELKLDLDHHKIKQRLEILARSDVIKRGVSDIEFKGLNDGTLNLIIRSRFEQEIKEFIPDIKQDFNEEIEKLKKDKNSLQGMLNNLTGKFAEYQLAVDFRSRQYFPLSLYFDGVKDKKKLNIINVSQRVKFQRVDGKEMEIDVMAESKCNRVVIVEVKKTKKRTGVNIIRKFFEKIEVYQDLFPKKKILPAFLSVGGFTKGAAEFCKEKSIGMAEKIEYFL
ncbi:ATPase domain-containing protein [Candidatus Magnetomoraceae bacterium gMMP-1]